MKKYLDIDILAQNKDLSPFMDLTSLKLHLQAIHAPTLQVIEDYSKVLTYTMSNFIIGR